MKVTDNFGNVLQRIAERLPAELDRAMQISSLQIRDNVASGISAQKWNWKPLSEKYKEFKQKHNASSKILISGLRLGKNIVPTNYRNSFSYQKIEDGIWTVGTNHIQGRTMEFGDKKRKIPARPHLKYAINEHKEDYMKNVKEALKRSIA